MIISLIILFFVGMFFVSLVHQAYKKFVLGQELHPPAYKEYLKLKELYESDKLKPFQYKRYNKLKNKFEIN